MGLESTTARDLLLVQQSCLQEAMTQERELQPKNEKPVISEPEENSQSPDVLENGHESSDLEILKEIYRGVRDAKIHFDNYCSLLAFTFYTGVYFVMLYLQAHAFETYQVAQAHSPLLPPGYAPNAGNKFTSSDDIYNWLNNSIIQTVWTPVACGNGICDRPQETPAYGPDLRFGCAPDCGIFNLTTSVTFYYSTNFKSTADQSASSWNLCTTYPSQFCWYKDPQKFTGSLSSFNSVPMDLPDGNWTFQLNAPNGGVSFVSLPTHEKVSNNLFSIGLGCNEEVIPSNYTICREQCNRFYECYSKEKCPHLSSSTYLSNFIICLGFCAEDGNYTSTLASKNCTGIVLEVVGDLNCDDDTSNGAIIAPLNQSLTSPQNISREYYTGLIWEKLGASDDDRLYRLSSAVQRVLYTSIKDECFILSPKPLSSGIPLTAFLCTFFGGPTNLTGCTYHSNTTKKVLTSDSELFSEMFEIHKRLRIYLDQQSRFTQMISWALQSVTTLDESTVVEVDLRLKQLDGALKVNSLGSGCVTPEAFVPMVVDLSIANLLFPSISPGDSVQFYWADDQEHSIVPIFYDDYFNISLSPEGFGAGNLILSRKFICSPSNIGEGGFSSDPLPCNLVNPRAIPPYTFQYTMLFKSSGTWGFTSGRIGDKVGGIILITDSMTEEDPICGENCYLSYISDGRCNYECNIPECNYDGGDCTCPLDNNGQQSCTCPSGQVRGYTGECCDDSGTGTVFRNFQLLNHSKTQDPAITNNDILSDSNSTLFRTTAKLNRVVIGLLVDQKRKVSDVCDLGETRFNFLQSDCLGVESTSPFGVSPQTLISSSLYDKSYLDEVTQIYSKNESFSNDSLSFNVRGVPFAFYPTIVKGDNYGFSYLFDINLDNSVASKLLSYLKEGFFLDNSTAGIRVRLATYNREARLFTLVWVEAKVEVGGKISVKADVKSLRVEHYKTRKDWLRFVVELVFVTCLAIDLTLEALEYAKKLKENNSFIAHFGSFWNVVDAISIAIMLAGIVLWTHNVLNREQPFAIEPRYDVYESPVTSFNYWKLLNGGNTIIDAIYVFEILNAMSNFRGYYFAISGINILLMCIRMLKLMDFQPRMGSITRTFAEAAPELFHFFIAWTLLFISFAFLAHIVFGRAVDQFRTIGASMNSCFRIILGQDSASDFLFQLEGWELAAGVIFWWSFVTIVVYVVMNLLIAIVVDAYASVKVRTQEAQWLPEDILEIVKNLGKRVNPARYSLAEQLKILKNLMPRSSKGSQRTLFSFKDLPTSNPLENKLSVKVKGVDLDVETLSALLRRAEERSEKPMSVKNFKALVEDVLDNLSMHSLSKQVEKTANDVEEIKESIARMESIIVKLAHQVEVQKTD